MAQVPPLSDTKFEQGRLLAERLFSDGIPLEAAIWIFKEFLGEWRLVLVSPALDSLGHSALFDATRAAIQNLNGQADLDVFDVDFESPFNPDVLILHIEATRWGGPLTRGNKGKHVLSGNVVGNMNTGHMVVDFSEVGVTAQKLLDGDGS